MNVYRHSLTLGGVHGLIFLACITTLGISVAWAQEGNPSDKTTQDDKSTTTEKQSVKDAPIVEDMGCELSPNEQLLATQLRHALSQLETQRLLLESKEIALNALKNQIKLDMDKLRQVQKSITAEMDKKDLKRKQDREKRIAQLANLLRKMRPENAANIIAVTEDKLAVATLDRLGERQASKLLEALPPPRAVQLANKLLALPFQKKEKK